MAFVLGLRFEQCKFVKGYEQSKFINELNPYHRQLHARYPLLKCLSLGHTFSTLFPKAYVLLLKGLRAARLSPCLFCLGLYICLEIEKIRIAKRSCM